MLPSKGLQLKPDPLDPMKMGSEDKEAAAVNLLTWTNN